MRGLPFRLLRAGRARTLRGLQPRPVWVGEAMGAVLRAAQPGDDDRRAAAGRLQAFTRRIRRTDRGVDHAEEGRHVLFLDVSADLTGALPRAEQAPDLVVELFDGVGVGRGPEGLGHETE